MLRPAKAQLRRMRRSDSAWAGQRTGMRQLYCAVRPRLHDGSDVRLSSSVMNGAVRHRFLSHGRLPKEARSLKSGE